MNNSDALKLIFVGNVGAGKTTCINNLSEAPVVGTEAKASEKPSTTVAMEYGSTRLNDTKLHIYGTPGQRRFNFMANLLCKGAAGMIVMINNRHATPLAELDYFLQFHNDFLTKNPAIVAITHYDDSNTNTSLTDYHQHVRGQGFGCPVTHLDAREKKDVLRVVNQLVLTILQSNAD